MRWPGLEPGSSAWKAEILAIIRPTLNLNFRKFAFKCFGQQREEDSGCLFPFNNFKPSIKSMSAPTDV